jgi:hypothetical protein
MFPRKCQSGGPARQCNDTNVNGALTSGLLPRCPLHLLGRVRSERFYGQRKDVADPAFGLNHARRTWIGLQFAP